MTDRESLEERLAPLMAEADRIGNELKRLLPELAAARRNYFRSKTDENEKKLDDVQALASELHAQHGKIVEQMQEASGLPDELFAEIEKAELLEGAESRIARDELTADKVESTALVEDHLPAALDQILR